MVVVVVEEDQKEGAEQKQMMEERSRFVAHKSVGYTITVWELMDDEPRGTPSTQAPILSLSKAPASFFITT
jgi:hypothetical protein